MVDIAPMLYEDIKKDFDKYIKNDALVQKILKGKGGTLTDVARLSQRIGIYATNSLKKNLTEDRLPDGLLYWNIAERTIDPIVREAYELINELASIVQVQEDAKLGINLKPIKPPYPQDRVNEVMNKLVRMSEKEGA